MMSIHSNEPSCSPSRKEIVSWKPTQTTSDSITDKDHTCLFQINSFFLFTSLFGRNGIHDILSWHYMSLWCHLSFHPLQYRNAVPYSCAIGIHSRMTTSFPCFVPVTKFMYLLMWIWLLSNMNSAKPTHRSWCPQWLRRADCLASKQAQHSSPSVISFYSMSSPSWFFTAPGKRRSGMATHACAVWTWSKRPLCGNCIS